MAYDYIVQRQGKVTWYGYVRTDQDGEWCTTWNGQYDGQWVVIVGPTRSSLEELGRRELNPFKLGSRWYGFPDPRIGVRSFELISAGRIPADAKNVVDHEFGSPDGAAA